MGWAWTAALAGGHGAEVAGASRVIRGEIDELYLVEVLVLSLTRLSALGGVTFREWCHLKAERMRCASAANQTKG